MRVALIAVAFAIVTALGQTAAHAQGAIANQMYYETVVNGPIGAWADFLMRAGGEDPVRMRYALVDRTSSEAVVEVESPSPSGPTIMRVVFSMSDGRATRAQVKQNGKSEDVAPSSIGSARLLRGDEPVDTVESIKTPAGQFQCKRYKQSTPQGTLLFWMSDKAFPSGLVKLTAPAGIEILLLKSGTGATPRF